MSSQDIPQANVLPGQNVEAPTTNQTPNKGRLPKKKAQQATPSNRTPKSTQQESFYASDGAAQGDISTHGQNGTPGQTQPKNTPKKKQNRAMNQYQQHGSESYPITIMDGTASPQRSSTATPVKQIYAGPTFHASPAASTLPMPKFFSKSVPSTAAASGLQAKLEAEGDDSLSTTPDPNKQSGETLSVGTPVKRETSPLDLFFNAHRAEQARKQSVGSPLAPSPTIQRPASHSPLATRPPFSNPSYHSSGGLPTNSQSRAPSGKDMFLMELDGVGDQEQEDSDAAPSNVTPFRERIAASASSQRPPTTSRMYQDDDLYRRAQSQALKKMLLTQSQSEPNGVPPQPVYHSHHRQASAPVELPTPSSPGSHVQQSHQNRQTAMRTMENDLRRILKLESSGN